MEEKLKEIIKKDERIEYNLEFRNGLWEFVLLVKNYWEDEDLILMRRQHENKYFLLAYGYVHVQNFYDDEYGEVRRNKRNRNKQYADNKLKEMQEMRKMLGLDLKPKEKQHIKNVERIERKKNEGDN